MAYWLISRRFRGRIEIFTVDRGGETLPVFGHVEEAEAFLPLANAKVGWRPTESRAGGLVSVLYGPCARVARVALDPPPEMVADGTVSLLSLSRERFVDLIVAEPGRAWARTG